MRLVRERKLLQQAVAFLAIIPVATGLYGVLFGQALTGDSVSVSAESHFRFLSGLLLAIEPRQIGEELLCNLRAVLPTDDQVTGNCTHHRGVACQERRRQQQMLLVLVMVEPRDLQRAPST